MLWYHFGVAGYSGTPLPQKLGIKDGSRVRLARAPSGFASGLDNKVCAIDDTWSGLRFVVRLSDRH